MNIKIENLSSHKIKLNLDDFINSVFKVIPSEHIRGINKIVIVDQISERSIPQELRSNLPGLYHPRMAGNQAWIEIAISKLLPKDTLAKRIMGRLSLKSNLANLTLSLVGQHYCLTLSHSVKKQQYETAVRSYVEKYFLSWRNANGGWRVKFFKPFYPYLDKFSKWLSKAYKKQLEQSKKNKK